MLLLKNTFIVSRLNDGLPIQKVQLFMVHFWPIFLHFSHHFNTVVSSWMFLKYCPWLDSNPGPPESHSLPLPPKKISFDFTHWKENRTKIPPRIEKYVINSELAWIQFPAKIYGFYFFDCWSISNLNAQWDSAPRLEEAQIKFQIS